MSPSGEHWPFGFAERLDRTPVTFREDLIRPASSVAKMWLVRNVAPPPFTHWSLEQESLRSVSGALSGATVCVEDSLFRE